MLITMKQKPKLSFWQIWNMSFGFLGIQFGFALQNANASRILQTFGADVEHLSWFWIAAPLTGMIVQPIVGHYSDKSWTRLGRRRPFFLAGTILACIALALMPNAGYMATAISPMFIGAGMLMIMDASINVAMEPFRALVADLLPSEQRTLGFSIQTFLIGIGAVIGSWMPYMLAEWVGISKTSEQGQVPDNVVFSFYIGAIFFLAAIIWTVFKTKEYPPGEFDTDGEQIEEEKHLGLISILHDFRNMPKSMIQLGVVQFFSWFALFSMWVYSTSAIATHIYGVELGDSSSRSYQDAANWVGVLFGIYNAVSAIYALLLPAIALKIGRRSTHAISLIMGAAGLISIYFIKDSQLLVFSMIGVGFAWGSILAMPYAILAGSIPAKKMGIYMGIFNFFITIPQIINGIVGGSMVKYLYNSQTIYAIVAAGVCLFIAAVTLIFVEDKDEFVKHKN